MNKQDMLDSDTTRQPTRKYNLFYETLDGMYVFEQTVTLRRPVLQMRRLALAVEQTRIVLGQRLLPCLEQLVDSFYFICIKARYQAANKRGFILALLITGVTIWLS